MAEHGTIRIPDYEYKERIQRAAKLIQKEGLDVLIVNSNEADYANARYFSGFWPLFERCGVAIAANGDAALMAGPESTHFAADRSKIEKIFILKEYRESADPSYPELVPDTCGIFAAYLVGHSHIDWIGTCEKYPEQKLICFPSAANDSWQNFLSDLPRTQGTKAEDCITVLTVDMQKRCIYLVRVGSNITVDMKQRTFTAIQY